MASPQQVMKEFEEIKDRAEAKALSKLSLKRPLTPEQTTRFLALGKRLGFNVKVSRRQG